MSTSESAVLDVCGLTVSYQTADGKVDGVSQISFSLRAGETVAVVGESGSGKSTTAAALVGLLAGNARIEGGSISLAGEELMGANERRWRSIRGRLLGFVPQDPGMSLDPVKRIDSQLCEAMTVHGVPRSAARVRARQLLLEVGLQDTERVARSFPHQLSGGMRQRVLIAIALANNPALIIADEPTSALDVGVQRQILDRLQTLARDRGAAVLLITHDLGVALDRADRLIVMYRGRIVETGNARQIFDHPQHAYTQQLLRPRRACPGFKNDPCPSQRLVSSPLSSRCHHCYRLSICVKISRLGATPDLLLWTMYRSW